MDPNGIETPASPADSGSLAATGPPEQVLVRLRLYVAPPTPSSIRAHANLGAILLALGASARHVSIETIDVVADPLRAIKDRIIVTPTLMLCGQGDFPPPMIGDLSDTRLVRSFIEAALRQTGPVGDNSLDEIRPST